MAGGVGSRFWPMSRSSFPKQFHDVLGTGMSLLQMTHERYLKLCPEENIYIVTNARYKDLVLQQLPGLKPEQVLCEPFMRNTAPCIAYANFTIAQRDPNAVIVVAPSDHLIMKDELFVETMVVAMKQAKSSGNLVTLGIKPHRPDTGYGYIQFEDKKAIDPRIKEVKTFTEKPNLELAQTFLESGDFYWNSGMFVWTLSSIQKAFEEFLPDMYKTFAEGIGKYGTEEEDSFIRNIYASCENISIDYGIMEKAENVDVVLSDFGWSDLGTWGSLYGLLKQDAHKNSVVGDNVMLYDSNHNMVHIEGDKLAVLQGLNNYIVVETEGILLVCRKEEEQRIKEFVKDVKIEKGEDYI
jgi:mannose-1-phosphate guanylyltransferase